MPDVICPKCEQSRAVTNEVLASITGKSVRCSHCKAVFVVHAAEDRDILDFLNDPAPLVEALKDEPTPAIEHRESKAEQDGADETARLSKRQTSRSRTLGLLALGKTMNEFVLWLFKAILVILAVIFAVQYSEETSGGGIAVLVFLACWIVILLHRVVSLLQGIADRQGQKSRGVSA